MKTDMKHALVLLVVTLVYNIYVTYPYSTCECSRIILFNISHCLSQIAYNVFMVGKYGTSKFNTFY